MKKNNRAARAARFLVQCFDTQSLKLGTESYENVPKDRLIVSRVYNEMNKPFRGTSIHFMLLANFNKLLNKIRAKTCEIIHLSYDEVSD